MKVNKEQYLTALHLVWKTVLCVCGCKIIMDLAGLTK